MKESNLDLEKITKALEDIEPEARAELQKLLISNLSHKPVEFLKSWINNFDNESPIDSLLGSIACQVITTIGRSISDDMKQKQESGLDEYSGALAMVIAIRELKIIVSNIESTYHRSEVELNEEKEMH